MDQLSNAKVLGVIILAARCLRKLNLPVPRMISAAAEALGVSRKAGYEAALDTEEKLRPNSEHTCREELQREVALLRIQNQILRFERDHAEVRFAAAGCHLPAEAKCLCVRILRDFEKTLSLRDIANAIGVPKSTLSRWNRAADSECCFPAKPERRGRHRHASAEDAAAVVKAFKDLTENKTLEAFVSDYNATHPDAPLDRRTITRILQAAGLYAPEPKDKPKDYHGEFQVYFPGAQIALDGMETSVSFSTAPQESITVVQEVAIDIATCAIVGEVLASHENADGVKQAVIKAREECSPLLAVLADNRSANTAAEAQQAMDQYSELGAIFTYPYHPATNGHVEGLFGQFSRICGDIHIDDSSRSALARSIAGVIWRIFIHFHNHSPRTRLDGKSPMQYLKTYTVLPSDTEKARQGLSDQQRRSRQSRKPHPRLSDPLFRALVNHVLTEHRFQDVTLDKAIAVLVHFDGNVIEGAFCAFAAYSKRDGFDEQKRHFRYFMGIVKKMQAATDKNRRNAAAAVLRAQQLLDAETVHDQELQEEQRREEEDLATEPQKVILTYCELLMKAHFRWLWDRCIPRIRDGLESFVRRGRTRTNILDTLSLALGAMPQFAEDIKAHMMHILGEQIDLVMGASQMTPAVPA